MDDENCETGEYVGETGIGGEQSRRERIVINKVLNNDEWARGISLASEQQQRSWEYCIQLRGSDSLQPRPLGEILVTFYNHTLRRQDETGDGLRRRSKPDSDSKNDCDENVEQEVIVRRSSPLDNGESRPKAETARRQNENEIKNKKFTDNPVPSQHPHDIPDGSPPPQTVLYMDLMGHPPSKPKGSDDDLSIREPLTPCRHGFLKTEGSEVSLEPLIDNPEAVMVEVKFNRNSTFLTGVVYYPNDVPPKQLVSQRYLRLTYPPGEFLFVTIPCLGQETSPSVRLRKKPLLSPGDSYTQGKLVGKPSAHHTIDDVTDKPSSNSSINLLEYNFRSESETSAFDRLRGALGVGAAGEQTAVNQAWFMVFDDEAVATSRSGQPENLAPLPQKPKILGAYHELIHLIGGPMSLPEIKILDKLSQKVSDIEFLAQIRNDKAPTQANFENELVLEMEAMSFELQAIINVVDMQIQILRSLAQFQLDKDPEKSVAVCNTINVIVGDRRSFGGKIALVLSKLRDSRQRKLDARERTRVISQQQALATAFTAQVASSEIAKVSKETNKRVENQDAKLFTPTLLLAVFPPIVFLTSYWGVSFNSVTGTKWKQVGSWGLCERSVMPIGLLVWVFTLQRTIRGESERTPWGNAKASKEIAKASEETNKRVENQGVTLSIFTLLSAASIPICFLTLYWEANFNNATGTKWKQVGFRELNEPFLISIVPLVWALTLQRTVRGESKRALWGNAKASKEIANVLEETNKRVENQGVTLFIFTLLSAAFIPICFLTLYWGVNPDSVAGTKRNQVGYRRLFASFFILFLLFASFFILFLLVACALALRLTIRGRSKRALWENTKALEEIANVLEETNKRVENQGVTLFIFTLLSAAFILICFLTLYWGVNPDSVAGTKQKQVGYRRLFASFFILFLLVAWALAWALALRLTIRGRSKRALRENTKALEEIAEVPEEINKHIESQVIKLSLISTVFIPIHVLASIRGMYFDDPITTNREHVGGLLGSCVLVISLVYFWWWALGRATGKNLCHPLPPDPRFALQQSKGDNEQGSLHSVNAKFPHRSSSPGASWFKDTIWGLKYMISRLEFSVMRASRRRSETLPIQVSWKCSCGTIIFDDFLELVEGGSWSAIPSTSHAKQYSSISRTRRLLLNLRLPSFAKFAFGRKTAVPIGLPNSRVQISNSSSSTRTDNLTTNNKYLLLCYNNRRDSIRLLHLDVPPSRKDQELFAHIRHTYYTARGWWRCLFSLKVLRRIEFVKFELYYVEDVDICARNDLPGPMVNHYEYIPRPAETIPPIGPNTFMHFFHNPDHAPTFDHFLNRMPKKLDGRVTIKADASTEFGWGIHFVEEVSRIRVFVMALAILLICFIFAILWTIIKGDIQGGFGVAGFLAAAIAVFISIVCVKTME